MSQLAVVTARTIPAALVQIGIGAAALAVPTVYVPGSPARQPTAGTAYAYPPTLAVGALKLLALHLFRDRTR